MGFSLRKTMSRYRHFKLDSQIFLISFKFFGVLLFKELHNSEILAEVPTTAGKE